MMHTDPPPAHPAPYGTTKDAIVSALRSGARTTREVASITCRSPGTVAVYFGQLCQEGRIRRIAHGQYEAV